ncbi:MAG: DNA-binding protein [Sulfuricurvum sp.]|jgi:HTH-type transcriptional regulator/antitoxin HigA|uniref:helix-turn-helix domain-containing protein n=1 Tax=Sulfuricurvum sp. TaxID=2025608 RepID=UPI0025D3D0EE|nr:DNA-binding protein [Sulfuricurvum sp.]MCK9374289.1 DNA-binding protein [Sulfuricurvum sp.]
MHLSPIRTEADYEKALERIDVLMEQEPEIGSSEGDELEILALLVEKYEEQHWHIAPPDPIEAIKYRMEEMGLKQKDLVPIIGSKSKVSEVLNRKIGLSLSMISNLSAQLHIPLEVLVPKVSV